MKYLLSPLLGCVVFSTSVFAVYAPIPEQEQGKAFSAAVLAGATYDTNIFAAPGDAAISSMVYTVSPRLRYNESVTDQMFVSAGYELDADYFTKRPGTKAVYSHFLDGRVAYAFTPATTLDVQDIYDISKNTQAALAGVPVNTDQSFKSNQFDTRFKTSPLPKAEVLLKFRSLKYDYDDTFLASQLNRTENLAGFEANYAVLPDIKAALEYRYLDIHYVTAGSTNDKQSNFLLTGVDYAFGKQLTASARAGIEHRHRDGVDTTNAPYAQLSAKYDYALQSFVSAGYVYSLEETDNPIVYTDEKVNQFFVNVQQAITALIVASASADYEPSSLQGRPGNLNQYENTTRLGVALTYLPTKNLSITASYDHDNVSSGDQTRVYVRNRTGLSATYAF
jgi:hypothetical protein